MTQVERQLLLVDLCTRLPYDVNVLDDMGRVYKLQLGNSYLIDLFYGNGDYVEAPIRPYLRSMSSMTDEEFDELISNCPMGYSNDASTYEYYGVKILGHSWYGTIFYNDYDAINWLNAHHFDYRGLIEKGLALEAHEGMYNNLIT